MIYFNIHYQIIFLIRLNWIFQVTQEKIKEFSFSEYKAIIII